MFILHRKEQNFERADLQDQYCKDAMQVKPCQLDSEW